VLAIASCAGKSTFLDILAQKRKRRMVGGTKNVMRLVNQEYMLMSTLTVYETVLYSASLGLPLEMSLEAKKFRMMETMNGQGILGIKESRIGDSGSISSGVGRAGESVLPACYEPVDLVG
jgi:ABC-type multidrug transport system ATPase subunit